MYVSWPVTRILLLLADLLIYYQAFGMNLPFSWCDILEGHAYLLGKALLYG